MAAFQALGPFISTFADPAITALLHNENGEIIITDREQLVHKLNVLEEQRAKEAEVLAAEKAAAAAAAVTNEGVAGESSELDSSESDNLNSSSDQETGSQQNITSSTSQDSIRDSSTAALENTLNNNPNTESEEITSTTAADDESENSVNNNVVAMDESTDEGDNEVNYTAPVPANNLQQTETENVPKQQQTSFEEKRASLYYSNNTKTSSMADNSDYSSFLYWREPVPPILDHLVEVDLTSSEDQEDKPTETASGNEEEYILNKLSDFVNKDCSERLKTVDVSSGGEEEKGAVEQQEKKEDQDLANKVCVFFN